MRPLALILALLPAAASAQGFTYGERNTDFPPAFPEQFRAPLTESGIELDVRTLVAGLVHPWGIATLPDDAGWLVTERAGRLRHVAPDGTLSDAIAGTPEVLAEKQGGMLDVALAPDFAETGVIYLTYAKPVEDGSVTAAARMVLADDYSAVSEVRDIFVQEPPSTVAMHYGSRIVPMPDGTLMVTTGEHSSDETRVFAQDLDKTYGKVIRITPEGEAAEGNPYLDQPDAVDTIWSYGHRNIQGAALDADGRFWIIEHGPKGGDELNAPEAGLNYGWPVISYGERYSGGAIGSGEAVQEGMEQPVYFWDPVIAPAGMGFHSGEAFAEWNGDLLIGSLTPGGVVRLRLEDGRVVEEERLLRDRGRIRDVEIQPDGTFIVLTDFENGSMLHVAPKN